MAFSSAAASSITPSSYSLPLGGGAPGSVTFEPEPEWVKRLPFDAGAPGGKGEPFTYLLFSEQQNVENRQVHFRFVVRLETMQAVQHLSQWRQAFDPATQNLAIHALRVHRGDAVVDYARPEKTRILQREEGLEAFVVEGQHSALVLLEDVRPGDILETSYTFTNRPRILPQFHAWFYSLPSQVTVCQHLFSIRFPQNSGMRWKGSQEIGSPREALLEAEVEWTWSGSRVEGRPPEAKVPPWHLPPWWLQVSNLPDWNTVAGAVARAWFRSDVGLAVEKEALRIEAAAASTLERAEMALRFVQDEFRYLSVNVELGGHVPTAPEEVIRRRYGDCKDLSFLLTCLLRRLKIEARPLLVNGATGRKLGQLLPSLTLFNHAIVELTIDGCTRWVDATMRLQGGGPLARSAPIYGPALPVDEDASGLVEPPVVEREQDCTEIHETLLLDTTGAASLLRVDWRATGGYADAFRQQMENEGLEKFSRGRGEFYSGRYVRAEPEETLRYEDDREKNEWRMLEIYRLREFVNLDRDPGLAEVSMPPSLAVTALQRPEASPRVSPFSLPYPLRIRHTFEIVSNGLQRLPARRRLFSNAAVSVALNQRFGAGEWIHETTLETRADEVSAAEAAGFCNLVDTVWRDCSWAFGVPKGIPRPRRGVAFTQMFTSKAPIARPQPKETGAGKLKSDRPSAGEAKLPQRRRRRSGNAERPASSRFPWWIVVIGLGALAGWAFWILQ